MGYKPVFTITARLLTLSEEISALREKILSSTVQVPWIPKLQKDCRVRNAHSSTALEGNPLTLAEVRALEEGEALPSIGERAQREVMNYFAGLRFISKNAAKKRFFHDDVLRLHRIIAGGVMDQGTAGRYREIGVRVGDHVPPAPHEVSGLMGELLRWWNGEAEKYSPVLSTAVLHFRFEDIHPFADGNGRTGRALALWELYRRGFDTHHIFSVDEFYWSNRPRYYQELDAVRRKGGDLTGWIEYAAEGLKQTLESVYSRIHKIAAEFAGIKIYLQPKQERVLRLLQERRGMTPREIWDALGVTRQGAAKIIKPLLDAGVMRRVGGKKTGKYVKAV